ncbi:hypothetical protein WJU23_09205 [Prosthecobacter sp. SYSU 5D2]|uniref:hypothetical protein n=1 Tax=Prosthecobacter sp. SYSU 5D2 TaxID=3134134 RepID=UPI0031FE8F06
MLRLKWGIKITEASFGNPAEFALPDFCFSFCCPLAMLIVAMTKSSHTILDLDNVADVEIVVPRATDLLMRVKRPPREVRWRYVIPGITSVAIASIFMAVEGRLGWNVYFWMGMAIFYFLGEGWQRQRDRQELMVDLLEALVAQNNEFRRQLLNLERAKN